MTADTPPESALVLGALPTRDEQNAYSRLSSAAAKGVAVVTAVQGNWDHAVTITDYLSVSYDPPTMLVSLYGLSRIAEAISASGAFGLSLLAAGQRDVAERFGEQGAPLVALLNQTPHFRMRERGPALIAGSLSWFELSVINMHEAATHVLVEGRVVAMGSDATTHAAPLLRYRSGYRSSRLFDA